MKLILANNQQQHFTDFYDGLEQANPGLLQYSAYTDLLFIFDSNKAAPITVRNVSTGKQLTDYDGVYINGYLNTYELAAATAICCQAIGVPFYNRELAAAPSLSKLTAYAKLAAQNVSLPLTYAGTRAAILQAKSTVQDNFFPAVLKRADADRGVDNYKVASWQEVAELLQPQTKRSLWLLQKYIENDGFYLVSFYNSKPAFCIFRSLQERPDGNQQKAHMYKPVGGSNAQLIELADAPPVVIRESKRALDALNRQIGSVDCIFDVASQKAYILEVNYNPQLVTIETFKDVRVQAFVDSLKQKWN